MAVDQTDQGAQLVLAGCEKSAKQAAASREASGHGRIAPKKPQQPMDLGLFASPPAKQLDIED